MHTYQVKSSARWAPPQHHRAPLWVVVPTEINYIPVVHRGIEPMQDEHRSKHVPFRNAEKQFGYHHCSSDDLTCAHVIFLEV